MVGSERRCHYEVLGLRLDCSADEIRPAYKKLALQLHPDKLVQSGLTGAEATAKFQELSHAYEVLSDPKERAWYDSHRSKILYADPTSTKNSTVPDLFSFFSNSAFSGYSSDSKKSFFRVYSEVFGRVYANELEFARKMGLGPDVVKEAPAMGDLDSPYSQASAFYSYWTGFSTVMDFFWADVYDSSGGPNRKSRRVMEDENAKARRKARREYNETVRGLAEFAKKRDKRVIDMAVRKREEEEKRKAEMKERRKKEERERIERAMAYREPEWAQTAENDVDNVADMAAEEDEENEEELYCVACGKKFKSDKQWKNHEQSKKHKDKVAQIRREMLEDDDGDGEEEVENEESVDDVAAEELSEAMKDAVRIDDEKDETEGKVEEVVAVDEVIDEERTENDEDHTVDVKHENGVLEDEIGDLEAMLGGRRNRKKAAPVARKIEESDEMEYNNRKSTRKSRRAKKGKDVGETSNSNNGNDASVSENGARPGRDGDFVDQRRVDEKRAGGSKSRGKKAKASSSRNIEHSCEKCGEDFESKNQLFKHLSDTGHATIKQR